MPLEMRPLTITGIIDAVFAETGVRHPYWRMRKTLDRLEANDAIDVVRAGLYRMVMPAEIPVIVAELSRVRRKAAPVAPVAEVACA